MLVSPSLHSSVSLFSSLLSHICSHAPPLHSSVHGRLCDLQEHLPLHMMATQLHLTNSTTASGAGATLYTTGWYVLSTFRIHPRVVGSNDSGLRFKF